MPARTVESPAVRPDFGAEVTSWVAQRRSKNSVDVILDAGSGLLEDKGLCGFDTNALAERACVAAPSL
jgi:hypothetical protein